MLSMAIAPIGSWGGDIQPNITVKCTLFKH